MAATVDLKEQRKALPDSPGVYLFKDARGKVIYVGKARSIRKRVASHFSSKATMRGSVDLAGQVAEVDFIATETEAEALLT
ncbi:MAG TPA: nucleotide excision repair endonuclease, partial [Thermoleophilaceae bacterium]|nr:nucleotide excision repair endonuclease [Thermoleophilaceae bacterium]